MPNQNVNKVIYGGRVLIDLTGDTVDPSKLLKGSKAHDKSGAQIEGACTFDVDSTDATAVAAEILFGKTAYVSGNKLTGTMKNNGAVTKKITTRDEEVTIPQGFHDGSGKVGIDATEKGKLIANNIREGVTILGVEGTMPGSVSVTRRSDRSHQGTTARWNAAIAKTMNTSTLHISSIPSRILPDSSLSGKDSTTIFPCVLSTGSRLRLSYFLSLMCNTSLTNLQSLRP